MKFTCWTSPLGQIEDCQSRNNETERGPLNNWKSGKEHVTEGFKYGQITNFEATIELYGQITTMLGILQNEDLAYVVITHGFV